MDAYDAFQLGVTMRERELMSGRLLGFNWTPFIERLKIRELWTRDIEEKLTTMEVEMQKIKPPAPKKEDSPDG